MRRIARVRAAPPRGSCILHRSGSSLVAARCCRSNRPIQRGPRVADRSARVRRQPQGPRVRARLPRSRRPALRGDVLQPPDVGGRPPSRPRLRRAVGHGAVRRGRGPHPADLRGRRQQPPRGRRARRRHHRADDPELRAAAAAPGPGPARAGHRPRRRRRRRPAFAGVGRGPGGGRDRRRRADGEHRGPPRAVSEPDLSGPGPGDALRDARPGPQRLRVPPRPRPAWLGEL